MTIVFKCELNVTFSSSSFDFESIEIIQTETDLLNMTF